MMKMKNTLRFLALSTFIFLSIGAFAQGTVKGIMTAEDQPEGLISATIQIGSLGTITEFDGSYEIEVPAGTHTIEVSFVGYDTFTEEFTIADGETKEINGNLLLTSNILETATVTSGKFEKPLGEVTVSLEVIKPSLAENTNSTTVDEVLEKVPGVTIIDGQANIRGGSGFSYGAGSRVLLLVDDIPILNGDSGFPSWNDVPVENIEQIEVVKGAASALYGSSALNGIINIRTAYAKNEPETQFAMYTETYVAPRDDRKHWWAPDSIPTPMKVGASIVHRQKFGKFDWVFGSTGYLDYSVIKNARDNKLRITNKFRYRANEKLNFGAYVNLNFGNSNTVFTWRNPYEGAYVGDAANMTNSKTRRFNIDPFLTAYDKSGGKHRYIGRWYSVNNDNANDQGNFADTYYNEYQYQRNIENLDMVVTGGVVGTFTNASGTLYGDTTFVAQNYAFYLQADKKFHFSKTADGDPDTDRNVLNISGGMRYEYNRLDGPEIVNGEYVGNDGSVAEAKPVFRLGMNYKAAPYTYIRASWGQGYRYPTVAEKYVLTNLGPASIIPNPDLESETGWSTEIGVKQGFQIGKFQGFVDLSGFWSEYQNMMEFNFTSDAFPIGFKSQNVGDTRIQGMEITVAGGTKEGVLPTTVLCGYTFINPKFKEFTDIDENAGWSPEEINNFTEGERNDFFSTSDENILKYRSRHSFKIDIESRVKMFTFGISAIGASEIEAIDTALNGLFGIGAYRDANPGGYVVWGARAAYNITDGVKVSIVGKNLANKEFSVRPGLIEPPMSWSLRVDAKF